MRFLANENFPAPSIALMRQAGYDVLSIQETIPGAKDTVVIAEAQTSDRIILTFDKDYGELIFKQGIPDPRQ
jgi:predicted nuclease of predicted toxin-antitoxin system